MKNKCVCEKQEFISLVWYKEHYQLIRKFQSSLGPRYMLFDPNLGWLGMDGPGEFLDYISHRDAYIFPVSLGPHVPERSLSTLLAQAYKDCEHYVHENSTHEEETFVFFGGAPQKVPFHTLKLC